MYKWSVEMLNKWLRELLVVLLMMVFLFVPAEISRRFVQLFYASGIYSPLYLIGGFIGSLVMVTCFFGLFINMEEFFVVKKREYRNKLEDPRTWKDFKNATQEFLGEVMDVDWPSKIYGPLSSFLIISKSVFLIFQLSEIQNIIIQTFGNMFYLVALYGLLMRHVEDIPEAFSDR